MKTLLSVLVFHVFIAGPVIPQEFHGPAEKSVQLEFRRLPSEGTVRTAIYSPSGRTIAVLDSESNIHVYLAESGEQIVENKLGSQDIRYLDDDRLIGFEGEHWWIWEFGSENVVRFRNEFSASKGSHPIGFVDRRQNCLSAIFVSDGEHLGIFHPENNKYEKLVGWSEFILEFEKGLPEDLAVSPKELSNLFFRTKLPTVNFFERDKCVLCFGEHQEYLLTDLKTPEIIRLPSRVLSFKNGLIEFDTGTTTIGRSKLEKFLGMPVVKRPHFGTSGEAIPTGEPSCVTSTEGDFVVDYPIGKDLRIGSDHVLLRITEKSSGEILHLIANRSDPLMKGVAEISDLYASPVGDGFLFIADKQTKFDHVMVIRFVDKLDD